MGHVTSTRSTDYNYSSKVVKHLYYLYLFIKIHITREGFSDVLIF